LGVNLDKDRNGAQTYIQQTGFKFPTIVATDAANASWDLPIARRYGITAIPRVMLIDQQGNVVSTAARGERLSQLLEQLLGPSGQPRSRATGGNQNSSVEGISELPANKGEVIQASAEDLAPVVPDAPPESEAPAPVPPK
jgi:hypothetical protein